MAYPAIQTKIKGKIAIITIVAGSRFINRNSLRMIAHKRCIEK